MAVFGYNAKMEAAVLSEKGLKYSPDAVFMQYDMNDFETTNILRKKRKISSMNQSFFVNYFRDRWIQKKRYELIDLSKPVLEIQEWDLAERMNKYVSMSPDSRSFHDLGDDVEKLMYLDVVKTVVNVVTRQHNLKLVFILFHPLPSRSSAYLEKMEQNNKNVYVVDVFRCMIEYMLDHKISTFAGSSLALSESDRHPSEEGHRIIADIIYKDLDDKKFFEI